MRMKRLLASVLAVCFFVTIGLTGCGSAGNSASSQVTADMNKTATSEIASQTTKAELPQVELKFYTLGIKQQEDTEVVEKAMDEILLKKINATIKLDVTPYANYDDKMNVRMAAGEEFDLTFCTNYLSNVAKGAYADITDMIPKYAPELQNILAPYIFDATRYKGRIYAVPNLQTMCMPVELMIRKDLFDKYNMPSKISSFDELDGTFDKILKDDKVIPLYTYYSGSANTVYNIYASANGNFFDIDHYLGVYTSDLKVMSMYDTDNFKNWVKYARKAYLKGWIEKGSATRDETQSVTDMKSGKYAAMFTPGGPQAENNRITSMSTDKYKYTFIDFGARKAILTTQPRATMNAISSTSKNPERAMMLLGLLSTDKDLYNLICFGVEGTHYILKDGFRDFPPGVTADNSKYYPDEAWAFGNTYNAIPAVGQDPELMNKQKAFEANLQAEPAMGFTYDGVAMKTQVAQVTSVLEEFLPSLAVGAVDPDQYLPKMLEKLKTAGADKIIEDQQAQLDKFIESKK